MAIVPWEPFQDLDRWFEDWDFLPIMPLPSKKMATDITQDKDNVYVEMELPGVKPENIEVNVEDNVLSVRARQEEKKEEKKKNYYRKEIYRGNFERQIELPCVVKGDKAKAEYKDGVLKIVLPKREEAKPKSVKIKLS